MTGQPEPRIYNRIAILRAERGLTRHDMADALGIDYQELGYIERGDILPDLELALRIGEYFGVPVEEIFSRRPFETKGGGDTFLSSHNRRPT
jgi:putative transcriptional regulator